MGLCASTAEDTGSISGGELRSLILHGMAKNKKSNMGDPIQLFRTQEKQFRAQSLRAEWSTVYLLPERGHAIYLGQIQPVRDTGLLTFVLLSVLKGKQIYNFL